MKKQYVLDEEEWMALRRLTIQAKAENIRSDVQKRPKLFNDNDIEILEFHKKSQ